MPFELSPGQIQHLPLENLTGDEFLAFAIEAALRLDWDISLITERSFTAYTITAENLAGEELTLIIDDNFAHLKSKSTGNLSPEFDNNKKNIQDFVTKLHDIKNAFYRNRPVEHNNAPETASVVSNEVITNTQPPIANKKLSNVLAVFKPRDGYFITPLIIGLNVLVFMVMVVSGVGFFEPSNESLINWGANFRPATLDGEWWRLITSCFLHIGIIHLLLNMYALLYIGLLLEPYLGRERFLAAYLLAGLSASVTSLWWHGLTISAGASGAIFGMYGVFLAMLTTDLIEKKARKTLLASIALFVGYNLAAGLNGGIDNAAHIGGLISGVAIGYALLPGLKKPEASKLKYKAIGILSILIPAASFFVYKTIPNDIGLYEKRLKSFVSMESMALEIYNLPKDAPRPALLSAIKERGIYYWNENIKLLTDLEKLDLPKEIHAKNKRLLHYCDLRKKSYHLIYKGIDENTNHYKDSIELYDKEIDSIISSLTEEEKNTSP